MTPAQQRVARVHDRCKQHGHSYREAYRPCLCTQCQHQQGTEPCGHKHGRYGCTTTACHYGWQPQDHTCAGPGTAPLFAYPNETCPTCRGTMSTTTPATQVTT